MGGPSGEKPVAWLHVRPVNVGAAHIRFSIITMRGQWFRLWRYIGR